MRRMLFALAAITILVGSSFAAGKDDEACFGTKINFKDTPKDAAKAAKEREKLVFILHVSGHFEDPRYT